MRPRRLAALVALAVFCALTWPAAQQPPTQAQLLQEGLRALNTSGDARGALRFFEQASRGPDRTLTARARLYSAMALERLDVAKARVAYDAVIRDFAEHRDVVAVANARLAVIGAAGSNAVATRPATMRLSRAWAEPPPTSATIGSVSRDGRVVAYQDVNDAIVLADSRSWTPLATIEVRAAGPPQPPFVPSPDGSSVATAMPNGSLSLLRSGAPPLVLLPERPGDYVETIDWPVPDRMLVQIQHSDRTSSLLLVPIGGSLPHRVAELSDVALAAALSPDGRFVAFDAPARAGSLTRDVFVVPVEGGPLTPLITDLSDDAWPVWSPRGDRVLFLSDRTGSAGLWAVRVREGRASGPASLLAPDLGRAARSLGVTADGAYYYSRQVGLVDVFTVSLAEGRAAGPPRAAATSFVGSNMGPTISPDGRRLAYLAERGVSATSSLGIRELDDDTSRAVPTTMRGFVMPRWSPDGRSVLVKGTDAAGRYGFHRIDATTGVSAPLLVVSPADEATLGSARWEADGSRFLYFRIEGTQSELRQHALVGDGDSLVFALEKGRRAGWFDLSADGTVVMDVASMGSSAIEVRARDGTARTVLQASPPDRVSQPIWSPDAREIFFVRRRGKENPGVWRMRSDGGDAGPIGVEMDGLRSLSVSPDARLLAFTAGSPGIEPWVLEHFLPGSPSSATAARIRR